VKETKEAHSLLDTHLSAAKKVKTSSWNGWYYTDPQLWRSQEFALICRHFPDIASRYGYDDLSPITQPITEGRFNTITAAHTIMALKSYSQLAKKSDVKLAIRALPRASENPNCWCRRRVVC